MICNNKNDTSSDVPIEIKSSPKNNKRCCCCQSSNIICIDDDLKGLHVDIHRGLFSSNNHKNSDATTANNNNVNWYDEILDNVQWHRVKYKSNRFQKDCTTPCYTAFYGGRPEYSPYTPIPEWFQPLIDEVTTHLGTHIKFNAFLLRLYFDGNDEIAWHTDGRTFLGDEPTIASLSLGCRATFQMRRMNDVWPCVNGTGGSNSTGGTTAAAAGVDSTTPIQSFTLNDGDLLVMRRDTQKHWHHRVPKEKGRGVRLNINFRYVLPGADAERGQATYYKYMVYGDVPIDSTPPSWNYNQIVAKKGGMMNFVQKGVKCPSSTNQSGQQNQKTLLSTRKRVVAATPSTGAKSDIERYLESESSVDRAVFNELPKDIQEELVSQWKSQHQPQQRSATVSSATSTSASSSSIKRKENNPNSESSFGKKMKKSSNKTIDSFFMRR